MPDFNLPAKTIEIG